MCKYIRLCKSEKQLEVERARITENTPHFLEQITKMAHVHRAASFVGVGCAQKLVC